MRSVSGLQLIEPKLLHESMVMVNLLGTQDGEFNESKVMQEIGDENLSTTLYGKELSRIKRKMGHVNIWGDDRWQRAKQIVDSVEI